MVEHNLYKSKQPYTTPCNSPERVIYGKDKYVAMNVARKRKI